MTDPALAVAGLMKKEKSTGLTALHMACFGGLPDHVEIICRKAFR